MRHKLIFGDSLLLLNHSNETVERNCDDACPLSYFSLNTDENSFKENF